LGGKNKAREENIGGSGRKEDENSKIPPLEKGPYKEK